MAGYVDYRRRRGYARAAAGDGWMRENRLPSLDGLRGFSVLLVLGAHLSGSTPALSYYFPQIWIFDGALGVRIFFVISGFIITHLLMKEKDATDTISISKFYLRRLIRLYPVVVAFATFLFVLTLCTNLAVSKCQYLTTLTYTKNLGCARMIDGPLWSLAVEEQFYLFWPLAILLLNKRNLYLVALLLVAVAPVSRALEYLSGSRLYPLLTSNIDALMIGGLLSLIFRDRPDFIKTLSARIPTVGRIAAVALMYLPVALSYRVLLGPLTVTLGPMIQAACAGYLIASFLFVRQGLGFALLNSKVLSVLGLLSYGLYVWQMPFLMSPETYGDTSSPAWLAFPTNLALIFAVSVASFFVLERPLVNLRKRLRAVG